MNLQVDVERLCLAQKTVRAELLAERTAGAHWVGQLASSPFATATAISALVIAHERDTDIALLEGNSTADGRAVEQLVQGDLSELLVESVHWLARHQNADGGWGDCTSGESQIAATMLVQAAFRLTGIPAKYADLMARADQYVAGQGGVSGLCRQYAKDKTLVAAILTNCALAGVVTWRQVPALPFETVCLSKRWQRHFPPPVSRHALPAFVSVGRTKYHHDPPRNPITRLLRRGLRTKSMAILERLQSGDGGFVDSIPVTAFVVMGLASIGCQEHPIVARGVEFLLSSISADASWRVENNLAVWNTTLAINNLVGTEGAPTARPARALSSRAGEEAAAGAATRHHATWDDTARLGDVQVETSVMDGSRSAATVVPAEELSDDEQVLDERCLNWLLERQHVHSDMEMDVPAGGWSRGDSPGSLPNAMDTASALLALARWRRRFAELQCERIDRAARLGIEWLTNLQSEDGGWPTFYRDGSSIMHGQDACDVTALVLRALAVWQCGLQSKVSGTTLSSQANLDRSIDLSVERGWQYLESIQREDGSFIPLWFGNEHHTNRENPVYGTAQVLVTCSELLRLESDMALRAARWLSTAQHASGGWGPPRAPLDYSGAYKDGFRSWRANETLVKFCSVEETALAVTALLPLVETNQPSARAVSNGLSWLSGAVEQDVHRQGAVIGVYVSKLWYHERLYPLAFAAGALSRAVRLLEARPAAVAPIG